jgi:hypothetical protein
MNIPARVLMIFNYLGKCFISNLKNLILSIIFHILFQYNYYFQGRTPLYSLYVLFIVTNNFGDFWGIFIPHP